MLTVMFELGIDWYTNKGQCSSTMNEMIYSSIPIYSPTGQYWKCTQIISHGFLSAALFFLARTSYDRIRLVYLDEMGEIAIPMPKIFTMFSIFFMASLALQGMSSFVSDSP